MLFLCPVSIGDAVTFVNARHRHHKMSKWGQALFAVACATEASGIVGVAVVGRPKARQSQDGWTAEVVRLATDGSRNACSMLYRAAWRAARALGYVRLVTYTLPEEGGGKPPRRGLPPRRRGGRRELVPERAAARG